MYRMYTITVADLSAHTHTHNMPRLSAKRLGICPRLGFLRTTCTCTISQKKYDHGQRDGLQALDVVKVLDV